MFLRLLGNRHLRVRQTGHGWRWNKRQNFRIWAPLDNLVSRQPQCMACHWQRFLESSADTNHSHVPCNDARRCKLWGGRFCCALEFARVVRNARTSQRPNQRLQYVAVRSHCLSVALARSSAGGQRWFRCLRDHGTVAIGCDADGPLLVLVVHRELAGICWPHSWPRRTKRFSRL